MDASLETLIIAAYVFACSLSIPRPGPRGKVTDQELIALAVSAYAETCRLVYDETCRPGETLHLIVG